MDLSGKRVLVTGADGFIGSHLTETLVAQGCAVRAFVYYNSFNSWGWLDHVSPEVASRLDIFAGDVRDPHGVRAAMRGCDVIFHLAALIAIPYSYTAPASYVAVNIQGTLNVLEACRRAGTARIVHTSTSEAYGTARYVPMDEAHPLQGQSPYSASKIGADKLAESYHLSFGLPVSTIRPFNCYGPRQSARAIIPTILTQMLTGRTTLRLGSLSPVRDFTYVGDTVDGFLRIAQSRESVGEVLNVGSGKGVTIGDVVKLAEQVCGVKVKVLTERARVRPEKSEVLRLLCSSARMRRLTGWKPRVTLRQGLESVREYLAANLDRYKTDRYVV